MASVETEVREANIHCKFVCLRCGVLTTACSD